MELKHGTTLQNNTYTIERKLGSGTFGITYLATMRVEVQRGLGSLKTTMPVTIKEFFMSDLNTRGADGSSVEGTQSTVVTNYRRKFRVEAENLSRMKHPGIVQVLEVWDENNTTYYSMEYIEGGSLDDYIRQQGPLPETAALALFDPLAAAVQYMHENRMLHLDLKPKNVMLSKNQNETSNVRGSQFSIRLIDFGLSKQYDSDGNPESSTAVGGGTPGYAPVEQADYHDGKDFPVTMDVYALGATLFKMLTGKTPPVVSSIIINGFPTGQLEQAHVTPATIAVIQKAMALSKRDRYQTVAALRTALTEGLSDTPAPQEESIPEPEVEVITEPEMEVVVLPSEGTVDVQNEQTILTAKPVNQLPEIFETFLVGGVEFKMVYVEGGTFLMGAQKRKILFSKTTDIKFDPEAWDDESPVHGVTLSNYYIGETVVTQELWRVVMGNNPSHFIGENLPVENVSYNDIVNDFLPKLNQMTGRKFRLPTEAEWEYAARGGNKSQGYKYSGSNDIGAVAWYNGNSGCKTHAVKEKLFNELGLYDMSGNVMEWCKDWGGNYSSSVQTNPQGRSWGVFRMTRGGGCYNDSGSCRVSYRNNQLPSLRSHNLGFRLVMEP